MTEAAIPARMAWALTLAGTLPFVAAAALTLRDPVGVLTPGTLSAATVFAVTQFYSLIIAAFMSGTLWGFAVRAGANAGRWFALSILPALALFFLMSAVALWRPQEYLWALIVFYPLLLPFDAAFAAADLAPPWWMRLRFTATAIVTASLLALAVRLPT